LIGARKDAKGKPERKPARAQGQAKGRKARAASSGIRESLWDVNWGHGEKPVGKEKLLASKKIGQLVEGAPKGYDAVG